MADDRPPLATPGADFGIGRSATRIDGPLKVTGEARYGSDFPGEPCAWAALAVSRIARGAITDIDEAPARAVPGVIDILTFRNVGAAVKGGQTFDQKGYMGTSIAPLASARIQHGGQIVAVVVAETFEAATEAAQALRIAYAEEPPAASFDAPGAETVALKSVSKTHEDPAVGDAEAAFASSAVKVDGR